MRKRFLLLTVATVGALLPAMAQESARAAEGAALVNSRQSVAMLQQTPRHNTSTRAHDDAQFTVPFTEGFDTANDFANWKVVDLNESTTWVYDATNKCVTYSYSTTVEKPGDDWLISPKFDLEAGHTYTLTFAAHSHNKGYPENFRFALGKSDAPESMTQVIVDRPNYEQYPDFKTERVIFTVPESGTYYLGLYCYSIAHNWTLSVDNIGIVESNDKVPAAVLDLALTPGEQGAMNATVACTAPSVTAGGEALSNNMSVNVYRNNGATPVHTWTDVAPGSAITWTDNDIPKAATYTYRVEAANDFGTSDAVEVSAFVGVDKPGKVQNPTLVENPDGTVVISWEPPVSGANGGWFDTSNLTYRIMRSFDGKVLATEHPETNFTDSTLNFTRQELCYYLIYCISNGTRGVYANTKLNMVIGPSIVAPFKETFPEADMTNYPWIDESNGSTHLWSLENNGINPTCDDQNGDRGIAMCVGAATTKGLTGRFMSPKVDISKLTAPQLSFWFYHSQPEGVTAGEYMTISISQDNADYVDIPAAKFDRDNGTTGWARYTVDLTPYRDCGFVHVAFNGTSAGQASMYIDNITIDNAVQDDVEATNVTGPNRIPAGVEMQYTAIISNMGENEARNVVVTTKFNDETVSPAQTISLPKGGAATVTLPVIATTAGTGNLVVTATMAGDGNDANNTVSIPVEVVTPVVPAPGDLAGTVDGTTVTLNWTAPKENPAIHDDFESYQDFAIDNIGNYTMVDRDYSYTRGIQVTQSTYYTGMYDRKAYQVINAAAIDLNTISEGVPHSGDKMLGSMASLTGAVNDDWVISPMLNGHEQTIEIFAKSLTASSAPERMRVLYSTGSTNPDDFVALTEEPYVELPATWQPYRYALPEGARYFAVNCVSTGAYAMMLDDFGFNDITVINPTPDCYEVYRDGELIATILPQDGELPTTYVDNVDNSGTYTYTVRARFNDMQSQSNDAQVTLLNSAVNDIDKAQAAVNVNGLDVTACGIAGTITLYNMQGAAVATAISAGDAATLHAPAAGIYLLTTPAGTHKVILK